MKVKLSENSIKQLESLGFFLLVFFQLGNIVSLHKLSNALSS